MGLRPFTKNTDSALNLAILLTITNGNDLIFRKRRHVKNGMKQKCKLEFAVWFSYLEVMNHVLVFLDINFYQNEETFNWDKFVISNILQNTSDF